MPIFGTVSSGLPLGFKNLIINGNFDVWQRATSTTYNNTTGYPAADRWFGTTNGGVNVVYSQQAGAFDQNGKANSCRVQRASGSSGRFYLSQLMETSVLDLCRGKTVTLSYWARRGSDFGASDLVVRIATQTNQTPREDGAVQLSDNTPSLTTSWQRFSHTLTLTSTSDSANGFKVEFIAERAGGTNVWYEIAQVQLEIGSVATSFEYRPYGVELELCQRYYQSLTFGTGNSPYGPFGVCRNAVVLSTAAALPVQMRAAPSISIVNNSANILKQDGATYAVTGFITGTTTVNQVSFEAQIGTSSLNVTGAAGFYGGSFVINGSSEL